MKSKSWMIWVFGVLLAIAAVDTVPDPPAVNPHNLSVASHLLEAGDVVSERLSHSKRFYAAYLQTRWTALTLDYEPNLPVHRIAPTESATDTSPPALKTQSKLFFRS